MLAVGGMVGKRTIALTFAILMVAAPLSAAAEREAGTNDRRAGMCEEFSALAFAFCVALCEARECDLQPSDDQRCTVLRRGFDRASGGLQPPC